MRYNDSRHDSRNFGNNSRRLRFETDDSRLGPWKKHWLETRHVWLGTRLEARQSWLVHSSAQVFFTIKLEHTLYVRLCPPNQAYELSLTDVPYISCVSLFIYHTIKFEHKGALRLKVYNDEDSYRLIYLHWTHYYIDYTYLIIQWQINEGFCEVAFVVFLIGVDI